ncbi:MarR family transcriptional regulator [Rhodococcus sp. SC4]|nr:MarR family transcriptional regulator [Rhodococcus sp. SC4]KXX56415.1 MarR family transcriptional regulator [Rhodococcus sp. LB1]PBC56169.1 MarR family transcriptional regulator [Rhodococcus sp. ACPA1]
MDERVDRLRENVVAFSRRIRSKSSGHLMSPTQMQALSHLDRSGPLSARALADLEQVAPQTIARTVCSLESRGMVTRSVDPKDARSQLISITEVGVGTLTADRARRREWLAAAIEERCTDVERELLFLAGGLLARLAEAPGSARPPEAQS